MILVAQIGARRHYAVPIALQRAGQLAGLYTDVCMAAPWLRVLGRGIPRSVPWPGWKRLCHREVAGVPDSKITCLWSMPWQFTRFKNDARDRGQYDRFEVQNAAFGRDVVACGFANATAVYAFNGAAVEIFEAAKARGLKCLLDMTLAPLEIVEGMLAEERLKFPHLEIGEGLPDWPDRLIARERREWDLADLILCGSTYVKESLNQVGVPAAKCRVVRWGYSGPSEDATTSQRPGPLRVLIAGTLDLRKGTLYALQAARLLAHTGYHFRFVGECHLRTQQLQEQFTDNLRGTTVEFAGAVPRSEMTREYQNADVLLHPSLAEGSANVCYEAMAHGLPVITTPNAGTVIADGVDGMIVPIRDPQVIAAALRTLRRDSENRLALGMAAKGRASGLTLVEYQSELTAAIAGLEVAPKDSPEVVKEDSPQRSRRATEGKSGDHSELCGTPRPPL